jgi:hypothetical protein
MGRLSFFYLLLLAIRGMGRAALVPISDLVFFLDDIL